MDKTHLFFAGSFDPFTKGHADIVDRALALGDVTIAIGCHPSKKTLFTAEERAGMISALYEGNSSVRVIFYDCLTVDAAKKAGCTHLVRGIRNVKDMEYEREIADMNRKLSGMDTVFLFTSPELASVSSSTVRELMRYGHDVSTLLPEGLKLPEK